MRTYLNALGIVCALGRGHDDVRRALLAGSTRGMQRSNAWLCEGVSTVVGGVTGPLPTLSARLSRHASRNNALLMAAALDIRSDVEAALTRYGAHRVGIVLGTSTSGTLESELALASRARTGVLPKVYDYRRQALSSPVDFLSEWLGISGPAYVVSTACTSSAKALASARRLLQLEVCDAVICGGVDTLGKLTVRGFASLEALSAERCNPFSANRAGINLGEAAALFLMTREDADVSLCGVGASADAHHMSSPDPYGRGAVDAMQKALINANLQAADIAYLNLHGTGTTLNDAMESVAVSSVFSPEMPCSSTKPMSGHTLGAAGALEAAFCWLMLSGNPDHRVPPHRWDGERDENLPALNLVQEGMASGVAKRYVMSNSFAFGGNNISVILEGAE